MPNNTKCYFWKEHLKHKYMDWLTVFVKKAYKNSTNFLTFLTLVIKHAFNKGVIYLLIPKCNLEWKGTKFIMNHTQNVTDPWKMHTWWGGTNCVGLIISSSWDSNDEYYLCFCYLKMLGGQQGVLNNLVPAWVKKFNVISF